MKFVCMSSIYMYMWLLAAIDEWSCYRLSMKPAVPSGPFGNRMTLSSMPRNSTGFCVVGWFSGDEKLRPYTRVELTGGLDVADALTSVTDPFVSFDPTPFLFAYIADSLRKRPINRMSEWDEIVLCIEFDMLTLTLPRLRHSWPTPVFSVEPRRILVHVAAAFWLVPWDVPRPTIVL